jgi:hypothetical protein
MKINVYGWCYPHLLEKTRFKHNELIDGDIDEAIIIAKELFEHRLNVMLLHRGDTIIVAVDNSNFGQR